MRIQGFILAIDSYLVRKGLVAILGRINGARVVKEIDAVSELIRYTKTNDADFLIISESLFDGATDLYLSESGLLEKTILLKTGSAELSANGVHTSIFLTESKEEIIEKITVLLDLSAGDPGSQRSSELTEREKTIVKLASLGLTNRQIAEKLFLSTHTVTTHRKNISSKLGIKSVSGLTIYAIVNNIITIEEATSEP
ncbi:MAG: response regulator transcription factor, partial [Bacteroidales bacterium]|nr:response regulator transcription factor [Bacteroidales bacterium]